jgi:UDP-glucose 4-epimerase
MGKERVKGRDGKNEPGKLTGLMVRVFTRIPLIHRVHPWIRHDKSNIRWLPINQDIQMPENAPMPLQLLDRLIEEASHRVIIEYCGCRRGFRCENYPPEIGCLMMGESALEIKRYPKREVGVDEAKAHARRAVEAGLVPVVGKARIDNFIFGVKDRSRLLTVCFCCECCCITRFTRFEPLRHLDPIFPRLDGIEVTVTERCKGCGKCVDHCYIRAITLREGKAIIGDYCRACGRCATVCPSKAIEVRMKDPEFLEKAYLKIRSHVQLD